MLKFRLNSKSKSIIKKHTGLDVYQISKMSTDEIDSMIEKKIGKKLEYKPIMDLRLIGRGSVYLFLQRLLNIKDADEKLSKI